jgi:CBS domain-containing protein
MSPHGPTPGALALDPTRVEEVMSAPLVTCGADVPLDEVAELMARHRIHALVVLADRTPIAGRGWGILSDLDLVAAEPVDWPDVTAGRIAGTPVVTITPDDTVARAAELMGKYSVTHLVAVGTGGEPAGIVSALDLARPLARGPERRAPAPATAAASLTARPGDRLVIRGHPLGEPVRDAEILEAHGAGGGPPFLVRWEATGRVSLFYPGSDAAVESTSPTG